jgi:hypothetical protein
MTRKREVNRIYYPPGTPMKRGSRKAAKKLLRRR